ncbi:MAG TPA: two-component regulator propeller domain-containing protein [Pyrinomonadaceae bacterium]|nr:two-component regulator propeller domain-containing protein [Pyrinomonadaceae bacterium]
MTPLGAALLLAALSLFRPAGITAQQLPIRAYTIADGLAHDQVDRIVQDSRGFMWFCTTDGLSRFDGYRFTNYGVRDGLPFARVNDIIETRRDGIYWVASAGGGLSRFDPSADARAVAEARGRGGDAGRDARRIFQTVEVGVEPQENIVEALYEDRAGNVWAGTQGGLFRLAAGRADGKFERVALNIPTREDRTVEVQVVREDAEGSLWVGTNIGVVRRLPDGRTLHHPLRTSQGTDYVWTAMLDREGRLWLGHQSGLLVVNPLPASHFSTGGDSASWQVVGATSDAQSGEQKESLVLPSAPGEARWFTTAEGLGHNNVQALHQTADGRVWVGTRGGGVSVFDGGRIRVHTAAHGLSSRVNTLAEDRDGNLWAGTQTDGALKLARGGFVSYAEGEGLGHADVLSIFEGPEGDVRAVSGKWTLNWFDGERFRFVRLNLPKRILDSSSGRWVIIQDRAGEWWAATGEGLYRFPAVRRLEELAHAPPVAIYTTRDGLADDNISRLFEDSRGDIWIGSYNPPVTLTRWERATGSFRRYTEADGIPPFNWANVFGEDRAGNLWIGLHNGGLARRRGERFEVFTTSDKVPAGFGQGFYLDRRGRLWVAMGGGGARLDEPEAEELRPVAIAEAGALSSNNLRCFAEDEWGRIYVGTARGVDRLDPTGGRVKHFTTADGLIKSEVMAALRDRAGALWFGTREGLSRLVPEPERPPAPPPVLIGGLSVGGVPQPVSELGESVVPEISLGPGQGQIQIDFFGLSFSAGEELRYQYFFEGMSRDWSAPTDQRTVTASLSPGKYRFMVRALNSDGTPSAAPATVTFRLLPPVWQRWWFLTLAALVVAAVIYWTSRLRTARAVALERVRTRIATDLHDDIGASLSQIAILSEVVRHRVGGDGQNGESPVAEPLNVIAGTSREMVDSMSDIVWAINPKRDRLSDLSQRMRLFASDLLSARDISLRFRAPDSAKDITVGADLRREVYLIFKESVNNLAKHSGCREASIAFSIEGRRLVVQISDDGRGFDVEATDGDGHAGSMGGHGLQSIRRRAEKLGGTYDVRSAPGEGTTVTLKVPVKIKSRRRLKGLRRLLRR